MKNKAWIRPFGDCARLVRALGNDLNCAARRSGNNGARCFQPPLGVGGSTVRKESPPAGDKERPAALPSFTLQPRQPVKKAATGVNRL